MDKATQNGIKNSEVFLVMFTGNYQKSIPKQQVLFAKGLNKPFRVLVDTGLSVPDWFKEGVKDYKQREFDMKLFGVGTPPNWLKDFLQASPNV